MEPNPPYGASEEEREAVGRAWSAVGDGGRPRREHLLPLLRAVQSERGWLSRGALAVVADRLGLPFPEVWGVATFYALLRLRPPRGVEVRVCDDVPCRMRGAEALLAGMEARHGPAWRFTGAARPPQGPGRPEGETGGTGRSGAEGARGSVVDWETVPCMGQCDGAPVAVVAGALCRGADLAAIERAAAGAAPPGPPLPAAPPSPGVSPAAAPGEVRRLLARVGRVDPASLDAYRDAGGYRGLARAVALGPEAMIRELGRAGLLGRGGAAFPAAAKWAAVAREPAPRWVVGNADESEPGTWKDRVLLEGDPFSVLEGLTIAALAVGAEDALVYVRGEYDAAAARIEGAVAAATAAGLLGPDCAGTGRPLRVRVFRGAGAYVCGEETALFASVEGRRGEPRNKPPFPAQAGLFGRPTLVQNVETLANVTLVAAAGADLFRQLGTEGSAGTKLFCVSGHVERPGVYEVPFGTPLRSLLGSAGGVRAGRRLRAVLCGGAAGALLGPERLDVPLSFEGLRAAGAAVGSGAVVALDETADLWGTVARVARFFREESCGQCVPCRVGTQRQLEVVERLAAGRAGAGDAALLRDLAGAMADASICGLGQTASAVVQSALALAGEGAVP